MVRPAACAWRARLTEARAPLIVTAELPQPVQSRADQLRREHYPPERNRVAAHVTLFHALPPSCEGELRGILAGEAKAAPPPALLDGLLDLGRGTALRIVSPAMLDVRARIGERLFGLLSAQDDHPPRLHITIQNKVAPREAKALQRALAGSFEGREFAFAGLALHRYRGGPWEFVRRWPFRVMRAGDQPRARRR